MMTPEQAVAHLYRIASEKKKAYHPSYDWAVEYSRQCKAYFAGVDVDEYLQQFARREADDLFEQRKEITAHINRSLGAALDRPFSKVPRSNYTKIVAFQGDDKGDRSQTFEADVLGHFTKNGLDKYVFERVRYWSKFDPNAFVVVEFDSTDGVQRARPYPFEVTAEMAVDFLYSVHGDLEYLVCRQAEAVNPAIPGSEIERLTMYQPVQTVVLQQLKDGEVQQFPGAPADTDGPPDMVENGQLVRIGGKLYRVEIPIPHNYPMTPAVRVGFAENPEDDGFTRVGIFDAALPFAKKIVKSNSELDIVMALLAFPVSVRYEDACDAPGCVRGALPDGGACMACRGSGFKPRPTSAQEELLLPMPRNPEDMFDLSKILHYTYPPTEAVQLQIDLLQGLFLQAKEAVFNSEMFSKQETAQTATYHGIALQSVYDTLKPYADNLARIWGFIADACNAFTGGQKSLVARLVFPQNFRFETAADLFAEMKQAREADAGADAAAVLEGRIMETILIDSPDQLARWRIDNAHNPFRGMSEAQILSAMSSGLVPEWKKAFWSNRPEIMADILQAQPDFYRLEFSRQRALIRQAAESLLQEIEASRPALNLGAFADDEPQPQPNE